MATPIGNLFMNLGLDSADYKRGLVQARNSLNSNTTKMNRSLAKLDRAWKKQRDSLKRFGKSMISTRSAIGVFAGTAGIGLLINKSLDFADSIAKAADAIGISTAALQEYRAAASLSGVSTEALDKALKFATKSVGELKTRTSGELSTALKDFDQTLLDNIKSSSDMDEALAIMFRSLENVEDQATKAALAKAFFGRAGIDLTNIVRGEVGAMARMIEEARELGLVIEDSLLRGSEKTKDQMDILARVIKARVTTAVLTLTPAIDNLARGFAEGIPSLVIWIEKFAEFVGLINRVSPQTFLTELNAGIDETRKKLEDARAKSEDLIGRGLRAIGIEDPMTGRANRLEAELNDLLEKRTRLLQDIAQRNRAAADAAEKRAQAEREAAERRAQAEKEAAAAAAAAETARLSAEQIQETIESLEFENAQLQRTSVAQEVYNQLKAAGIELNDAFVTASGDLVGVVSAEAEEIARLVREGDKLQQALDDVTEGTGDAIEVIDDLGDSARTAGDIIEDNLNSNLRRNIETWQDLKEAALDAIQNIILDLLKLDSAQSGLANLFGLSSTVTAPAGGFDTSGFDIGLTPRALGGPTAAGVPFLVGEEGPELFVPDLNGQIISNDDLMAAAGGSGGNSMVVNFNGPTDGDTVRASLPQLRRAGRTFLGRGGTR